MAAVMLLREAKNLAKSTGGRQCLIIFTRYPAPGKTKTRLIPVLGPEGAAELQRRMSEHILGRIRSLALKQNISIEVRYEGGSKRLMKYWLGRQFCYRRQGEGNIGMRMAHAFQETFAAGIERAVLMGTDCPGITGTILQEAFDSLDRNDVVLGPAHDGGYYLIGLRRLVPELFRSVPWGTDKVLERTMQIAKEAGCSVGLVQRLNDVDNPEDLIAWEREERRAREELQSERISIIIPTLNEAPTLPGTLEAVRNAQHVEIIIVDGGSSDHTVEMAASYGVRVVVTCAGRARQMNAGAAAATGDILLFLHADTRLPDGFDEHVRRILACPRNAGGAFRLSIDAPNASLRLVECLANWRSKVLQMPYGDQALFLKTALFRAMGGFPNMPIMEDFALVRRLRKQGSIALASVPALTSARRWLTLGIWRTTLIHQGVIAAYYAGVPLQTITRWRKDAHPGRKPHG